MAYKAQYSAIPGCTLTNLQDGKWIEIPCYPDDITMSVSSNWNDTQAIGRSEPITAYTGTNFKEYSFTIGIHRDFCEAYLNRFDSNADFDTILVAVENTVYAKYGAGAEYHSPLTMFTFGTFRIEGAVTQLSTKYTKPIDAQGRYMYAEIGINIKCIPKNLPSYEDFNRNWDIYLN